MFTVKSATTLVAIGLLHCFGAGVAAHPASGGGGKVSSDVVIAWNQVVQDTVPPTAGLLIPRYFAMVHIAQFDAVNSIERRYTPYRATVWASRGASTKAAAAQAAHDVLLGLLPANQATYDAALANDLAGIPPGQAAQGVAVGKAVARKILDWRADDGATDAPPPYVLPPLTGLWQGATPGASATFTQVPHITPFAVRSTTQFLALRHPELNSQEYAVAFEEVKLVGSATSSVRTSEQTQLARLWAGVITRTSGFAQWNNVARDVSRDRGLSILATARAFALLNVSMQDGLLTSQTGKLIYGFWRPTTAIRRAGEDLNDATAADPTWTSLIPIPPYPSYPGNMACIGAVSSRALTLAFGTDAVSIDVVWKGNTVGGVTNPDVTQSYTSLSQLGRDEADSRIYGGIHFRFDNSVSQEVCPKIAEYAHARYMRRLY